MFLLFLDNAFLAWQLTLFSDLLGKAILFLPKLIIACAIFGVGWMIASLTQKAIQKALVREGIPRATLITLFVKSVIVVFFSAMAIVVIDVAKEIVVIAFATIVIGIAVVGVIFAYFGGKDFFAKRRNGDGRGKET